HPAAQRRHEALDKRLLELQRHRALPEPDLLPCKPLAGQSRRVGGARGDDPAGQHVCAHRGSDAGDDWQCVHTIAVRRRMIPLPTILLTMLFMALSIDAPGSISRRASANSSATGGPALSVTALSDWATGWPACIELAISSIARGSPASNWRRRCPRRLRRYSDGST